MQPRWPTPGGSPLSKLLGRSVPGQVFVDPGFVFAATRWEDAAYFRAMGQLVLAPRSRWEILGPGQPPGTLALRQLHR